MSQVNWFLKIAQLAEDASSSVISEFKTPAPAFSMPVNTNLAFDNKNMVFISAICEAVNKALFKATRGKLNLNDVNSNTVNISQDQSSDPKIKNLIILAKYLCSSFIKASPTITYTKVLTDEEKSAKKSQLLNLINTLTNLDTNDYADVLSSTVKSIIINNLNQIQ